MKKPETVLKHVLEKLTQEDARNAIFAILSGHHNHAFTILCQRLGYKQPEVKIGHEAMKPYPGAAAICIKDVSGKIVIMFRDIKLSESFFTALHEFGHAVYQYEGLRGTDEEAWATDFEMAVVKLADISGLKANR